MLSFVKWLIFCLLQLYEGVKPTLGELEKFEATPDEVELNGMYAENVVLSTRLICVSAHVCMCVFVYCV